MNHAMKRTIILAIAVLAAASCTIDPYSYYVNDNNRTGNKLAKYSGEILDKFGIVPVEDIIYMLTLDEFLKLTEEEQNQPQWANFKSNLEHYTDTYLRIPSKGISVDTRGLSLTEPGNSWTMEIFDQYSYLGYSGYHQNMLGYFSDIPGHSNIRRISCTAENEYEIYDEKGKESMNISLEAIPSPHGGYDFTGSGSGNILANKRGLSAEYSLQEIYYRKYRYDEDGTGNSSVTVDYNVESLLLKVYTYHNGQSLDWCEVSKKADGPMEYRSNLIISLVHTDKLFISCFRADPLPIEEMKATLSNISYSEYSVLPSNSILFYI